MKCRLLLFTRLLPGIGSVLLTLPTVSQPARVQSVSLTATPLVLRTAGGEQSVLAVTLVSDALSNATVRLSAAAWPPQPAKPLAALPAGTNRLEIEVPALTAPVGVKALFQSPAGKQELGPFTVAPPRRWTVYLTQHTHTDIGYTRPQTEILPEHLRYVDYALDYCDLTDGYPPDAQFRWTCETAWAVREYFSRRPPEQLQRLKKRLQEGRIEITGMLLNMAEIATESSLAASLQPLLTLKKDFGVPVRTAMQNDVNGAAWCLVDYFSDIGLKYLTMGINQTRSLLPFDKPTAFWWESPSGKRILAFRADHYMTANFWRINDGKLERFAPEVVKYLQSLERRGYPFDRVGVQFSGYYTDNSPPSTVGCEVVKAWNEKYAWPKLRLSTAQEFLAYVEQEHAQQLPVHRQAWPDWWTDGFGSAARETGAARETESAMQVTQGLLAMAVMFGAPLPASLMPRLAQIQENLLFYAEHTWGAAESIDDPLAANTQVQWAEKSSYVWEAVKQSNLLREEAFGLVQDYLPRAEVPTIAVLNTLNWERSGLVQVFIDHEILPPEKEFRIVDAQSGEAVPAQAMNRRAEGTYWALWVKSVPPLGYRTLRIEAGQGKRPPAAQTDPAVTTLSNAFYTLAFDPERGALKSVTDKETGQELVDPASPWGLGQCVYETLAGGREMKPERFKRASVRNVKLQPGAGGPIWKSLVFAADLDGCPTNRGVKGEFRLYETEKRLELHFTLRKLPIASPEALYVTFPFQCPGGKALYEGQGGLVIPGETQIPGSSSDWQTIQNFIAIRAPEGQIVQGSDQVPLVQLGDFNLGKWQPVTKVDKPHVYSWVMNNYWFTNFRATQEGDFKWSYYLTSAKDASSAFATRFGWGSRVPLAARVFPPGKGRTPKPAAALSLLNVNVPGLLLVEARPAARGPGIIVHLREVEGKPATASQDNVSAWAELRQADEVNVLEETLKEAIDSVSFQPFESKFVRVLF